MKMNYFVFGTRSMTDAARFYDAFFAGSDISQIHAEDRITVSYWQSLDAVQAWKRNVEHREAQRLGRASWYAAFRVRIAKIEREYIL